MRKLLLVAAGAGLLATLLGSSGASASPHCYTLGDYQYCTYLPVDPSDIIR